MRHPGGLFYAFAGLFTLIWRSLRNLQTDLSQGAHAHEVVGSHGHGEEQADLLDPAHHHLTNRTNELAPTKALFNELALFLRDGVALAGGNGIRDR